MKELIIVSMTTWSRRISNIPTVLDSIFAQTLPPDLVVINIAFDEKIPGDVEDYLHSHGVDINRVEDTKVYKKIVPTFRKYPNACVINIDDDWIYPPEMICDFINIHNRYPNNPISGNRVVFKGMQCHHGFASLTKADYFGNYLDFIVDKDVMSNCSSSDIVYTFFANMAGHPYIRTEGLYYYNMKPYNQVSGYSENVIKNDGILNSYNYLTTRFGNAPAYVSSYLINNDYISDIVDDIYRKSIEHEIREDVELKMRSTFSYKIGKSITSPFRLFYRIKRMLSQLSFGCFVL